MHITLKNDAGLTKEVKVGFSWTTLLFGFFPALIRGDLKWAVIMFIIAVVAGSFTFGFGAIVSDIIFAFVYNKIYIKELIEKGYKPANKEAGRILAENNILSQTV